MFETEEAIFFSNASVSPPFLSRLANTRTIAPSSSPRARAVREETNAKQVGAAETKYSRRRRLGGGRAPRLSAAAATPRRHRARTARGASPALSRGLSSGRVRSCSSVRRSSAGARRRSAPAAPTASRALFAAPSRGRGAPRPRRSATPHATTRGLFSAFGQNGNAWPTATTRLVSARSSRSRSRRRESRPSPRLRLQLDDAAIGALSRPATHGLAIFEPEAVRQRQRDLYRPVAPLTAPAHAANGAPFPREFERVRLNGRGGAARRARRGTRYARERVGDGARQRDETRPVVHAPNDELGPLPPGDASTAALSIRLSPASIGSMYYRRFVF